MGRRGYAVHRLFRVGSVGGGELHAGHGHLLFLHYAAAGYKHTLELRAHWSGMFVVWAEVSYMQGMVSSCVHGRRWLVMGTCRASAVNVLRWHPASLFCACWPQCGYFCPTFVFFVGLGAGASDLAG